MSDNYMIIIPREANFVPSEDAQRKAVELFHKIDSKVWEVKTQVSNKIRFIHCGDNFESICCPKCNRELDTDFWSSWMSEESKEDFPLRAKPLPCCGEMFGLDELTYEWPQGFARFSLEAMNPHVELSSNQIKQFEKILGCRVRKVHQHI